METGSSERSILLSRVLTLKASQRIRSSLQLINHKENQLIRSRCSSASKKSMSSKMHRSVDLTAVTPKAKLLMEIADKLKSPKVDLLSSSNIQTAIKSAQEGSVKEKQQSNEESPKKKEKKGRLEMLLRDIKKCNQVSTKAVSTIRKNVQTDIWTSAVTQPSNKTSLNQIDTRNRRYEQPK